MLQTAPARMRTSPTLGFESVGGHFLWEIRLWYRCSVFCFRFCCRLGLQNRISSWGEALLDAVVTKSLLSNLSRLSSELMKGVTAINKIKN